MNILKDLHERRQYFDIESIFQIIDLLLMHGYFDFSI
jgi:hypothetical protein